MKRSLKTGAMSEQDWSWPIKREQYDQSPDLTDAEREHLQAVELRYREGNGHGHRVSNFYPLLYRLMRPIKDVLEVMQVYGRNRSYVEILMLREMHRRNSSFWAWSGQEWVEFLGPSAKEYQRQHKRFDSRPNLITLSYLLCDFTEFPGLGGFRSTILQPRCSARTDWRQ